MKLNIQKNQKNIQKNNAGEKISLEDNANEVIELTRFNVSILFIKINL